MSEKDDTLATLSVTRGPMQQLKANLSGKKGLEWLTALNKFLRKEEAWKDGTVVNFLNFKKKGDWRYETWRRLSNELRLFSTLKETIYWIGIVDLKDVGKDPMKGIPISFAVRHSQKPMQDYYCEREVDGAEVAGSYPTYGYNLSEIHPYLLGVKKETKRFFKKYRYVHLFLEEKVDNHGAHSVALLYYPKDKPIFGYPSKVPWTKDETRRWAGYAEQAINDKYERIYILTHSWYQWMK